MAQANNISIVINTGAQAKGKNKKGANFSKAKTSKSQEKSQISRRRAFLSDRFSVFGRTVKAEEIYNFANQLSILLDAGVPLVTCLRILSQQAENEHFKKIVLQVTDDINGGANFTQALAKHPKIFPKLFISMMRAAEKGGQLVEVLAQLAVYLEQQYKLNKKLKAAMVYPKFVFSFFALVLVGIVFGLVPKFQAIFEGFNAELPLPTQILIELSHFAKDYLIFEIGFIVGLVIFFQKFKKTAQGESIIDSIKLRLPMLGDVISKTALSRVCRTLSILIRSGVSLVDALEISGATAQNVHFTSALKNVKKGVIGGESLSAKLSQHAIFPIMVISMIATGEQSGSLDKMLTSISDLYDTHVDAKVSGLSSIIEPVLMVGLGITALIVIVALYLPIFFMGNAIN